MLGITDFTTYGPGSGWALLGKLDSVGGGDVLVPLLGSTSARISFSRVGSGSRWQVDDLYVDPWGLRAGSTPRAASAGKAGRLRHAFPASVPCMATTRAATPWGRAELVEELTLRQQAGERRFASVVQLLETERGERLVRFAYSTGGTARRGPVTLRARDIARLRAALDQHPALAEALGL